MPDFEAIERMLDELLNEVDHFDDGEKAEVRRFIDVGEYGLALEAAYYIAIDRKHHVPARAVNLFSRLASDMGITDSIEVTRLQNK